MWVRMKRGRHNFPVVYHNFPWFSHQNRKLWYTTFSHNVNNLNTSSCWTWELYHCYRLEKTKKYIIGFVWFHESIISTRIWKNIWKICQNHDWFSWSRWAFPVEYDNTQFFRCGSKPRCASEHPNDWRLWCLCFFIGFNTSPILITSLFPTRIPYFFR